jgi:hypothetical protein
MKRWQILVFAWVIGTAAFCLVFYVADYLSKPVSRSGWARYVIMPAIMSLGMMGISAFTRRLAKRDAQRQ